MTLRELYEKEEKLCVGHHFYYLRKGKDGFRPNSFATKWYICKWEKDWLDRKVIEYGFNEKYKAYSVQLGYKVK